MDDFKTIEQYFGTSCFYCNSPDKKKLEVCGRCRRVFYCGKECQTIDWKSSHRAFCLAWRDAVRAFPLSQHPTITSHPHIYRDRKATMKSLKTHLMDPITKTLGPLAGKTSTEFVFRAPRCSMCLAINTNSNDSEGKPTFHRCSKCVAQWCRRDQCRVVEQIHEEAGMCATLSQIAREDNLLRQLRSSAQRGGLSHLPARILRVETPLPLDWSSYLKSIDLPAEISAERQNLFVQHSLSIPLTIVASLEEFGLLAKFSNDKDRRVLTIHIIGAEKEFEVDFGVGVLEEITHLLPGVRNLIVVMIGPELKSRSLPVSCCDEGRRRFRTRRVDLISTTYHDFINSPPTETPPADLAVALNSGVCENPSSWKPTIDLLLQNRTPAVFTSLNQLEAAADSDAIRRMGGPMFEMAWESEASPFPSGTKHFDLFTPGWFWSPNLYWSGWRGKGP